MPRDYELMWKSDQVEQAEVCRELAPQGLLHALGQPWKALAEALRTRNFENKRLIDRVAALEDLAREWRDFAEDLTEDFNLQDLQQRTAQLLGEEE